MSTDELKQHLTALGAKAAVSAVAGLEQELANLGSSAQERLSEAAAKLTEAGKRIGTLEERLQKAMEREGKLKTENDQLKGQRDELARQIERLDSHPEVRAAKRKQLEEQMAALAARHEALLDPESPADSHSREQEPDPSKAE